MTRKSTPMFPMFADAVREYFKEPTTALRLGSSRWYKFPEFRMEAYMRYQVAPAAYPLGTFLDLLVIANVHVMSPRDEGKGHFTRFREAVEALADEVGVHVVAESILDPRLVESFKRHGYKPRSMRDTGGDAPTLIRDRSPGC